MNGHPLEGTAVSLPLISEEQAHVMTDGGTLDWFAVGYPRQDDIDAAKMVRPGDDDARAWSVRHVVRRQDGLAVGTIGFFGPPAGDGLVEVGFGLVDLARGKGLMTDALSTIVAAAEAAGATVIAHTTPGNIASQRTLATCGFVREDAADGDGDGDGEWRYVHRRPTDP